MVIYKQKTLAWMLALVFLSVILTGCSSSATTRSTKEMKTTWFVGTEPKTLDPQLSMAAPEAMMEMSMFEGLTRLDKDNVPQQAVAEKWESNADGTVWTFHLRDAKWTNGDPVTAEDFKFAWTRALDPATGSRYADQFFYIKGGEAFNNKSAKAEDVGIKVIDPKTLEVTLEAPTPYFLSLTAFPSYYPVNKGIVSANKDWALKPESFVVNGPFKLKDWKHSDELVVEKNDSYWDAKSVKLSQLTFKLLKDSKAAVIAFDAGQLDGMDNVPTEDVERYKGAGKLKISPKLGNYYYDINLKKQPFDNPKVRKALSMSIDRKKIVENITKCGEQPAYALVPPGIIATGKDFRTEGGQLFIEDIDQAKKLLAEAGYPEGKGFPKFKILFNSEKTMHKLIAENVQDSWKKNLGLEVELEAQDLKTALQSRFDSKYDVARAGWNGDYFDAMTFLDMWMTDNPLNSSGYSNKVFDKLLAEAKKSGNQKVRLENMHQAEKIFIDDMGAIPVYFELNTLVQQPYVKNISKSMLGYIDFKYAEVAKN